MSANASKIPGLSTERGYELMWVVEAMAYLLALVIAVGYLLMPASSKKERGGAVRGRARYREGEPVTDARRAPSGSTWHRSATRRWA